MKGFMKRSTNASRLKSTSNLSGTFIKTVSNPKIPMSSKLNVQSIDETHAVSSQQLTGFTPYQAKLQINADSINATPECEIANKFRNRLLSLKAGTINHNDDNLFAELCEDIVLFARHDTPNTSQELTGNPINGLKKEFIDLFIESTEIGTNRITSLKLSNNDGNNTIQTNNVSNNIVTNPFFSGNLIEDPSEAFYVVDLGDVMRAFSQWNELLPYVKPFYAIKCNNNLNIIKMLKLLGCGFDCASKQEFEYLYNNNIIQRNDTENDLSNNNNNYKSTESNDLLVFSNPCKHGLHLEYARENGINLCTFDSEYELDKIKYHHPDCDVLLRVAVDDSKSICQFNSKFGVSIDDIDRIDNMFNKCVKESINIVGIMFHVGSGCTDASVYYNAIANCRELFDLALIKYGLSFSLLDLGGGFTCDENTFSSMAREINQGLIDYFSNDYDYLNGNNNNNNGNQNNSDVFNNLEYKNVYNDKRLLKIIAEPGRYFAEQSHTLVSEVFAKKLVKGDGDNKENNKMLYYINEGLYHSFNAMYFDHQFPNLMLYDNKNVKNVNELIAVSKSGVDIDNVNDEIELMESKIFGPTCDSMDKLYDSILLPELNIGDKLITTNFGAYSISGARNFNGFPLSKSYHVVSM